MKFEDLKLYFEEKGYEVLTDGNAPYRRIIFSKQNYGDEYYEADWTGLSNQEQFEELEETITAFERMLSK